MFNSEEVLSQLALVTTEKLVERLYQYLGEPDKSITGKLIPPHVFYNEMATNTTLSTIKQGEVVAFKTVSEQGKLFFKKLEYDYKQSANVTVVTVLCDKTKIIATAGKLYAIPFAWQKEIVVRVYRKSGQ